ncbi:MAG: hypothetical protein S0880_08910 [Actinomycetota bacterium]|nr:hypothetical protein [Actinomycetota bacterium]
MVPNCPVEVAELADDIHRYWVDVRMLDERTAAEMRDELRDHLCDAAAAGHHPDEVMGDDPRAFADEWADQRDDGANRRRLLWALGIGLGPFLFLAGLGAPAPPYLRATVSLRDALAYTVGFAVLLLPWMTGVRWRLHGGARERIAHRVEPYWVLVGVAVLFVPEIAAWSRLPPWNVDVGPWLTVPAAVAMWAVVCWFGFFRGGQALYRRWRER